MGVKKTVIPSIGITMSGRSIYVAVGNLRAWFAELQDQVDRVDAILTSNVYLQSTPVGVKNQNVGSLALRDP